MDLHFTAADTAFRDEVRAFIASHFPANQPYTGSQAQYRQWADALVAKGWSTYKWPVVFGGTGWSPTQKFIWERETSRAGLPHQIGGMGMMMLAPVLYTYGTTEQIARHLPGIADHTVEWCQGYSEPGAGSDLAAIRTTARPDGYDYVVTGEKVWTSWAHIADWMFCLVRTESGRRPQDGITFLLIDMTSPGITVHPIHTIDGEHTINRVTLDDVRVPMENRIGEEGAGWSYAKALLTHERTGLAYVSECLEMIRTLKIAARETQMDGRALFDDPLFMAKLADVETELAALEITELRTLVETETGQSAGPQSSILKLCGTLIIQRITELYVECAGYYAAPFPDIQLKTEIRPNDPIGPAWALVEIKRYLAGRAASIAGGTNEVQRNIIAKHVLGLPT